MRFAEYFRIYSHGVKCALSFQSQTEFSLPGRLPFLALSTHLNVLFSIQYINTPLCCLMEPIISARQQD
ncbi:Uncharacterised protein [Salmonella enterica subsp. enterica serovar Bovismorbificans]|uniref:Uncharacterized protein n=1 Tax=Salmonella enterica subsp. enterica serovar Bovismorbificans TaxID=58097 RepID=A0A655BMV2_SALET|nr:Uncharacterised protein [Salmonella enterica subsp. enterica serovar Bovismorbificans]